MTPPLAIPLSGWADAMLRELAEESGSEALRELTGAALVGERAAINGFRVPGRVSAGGGCRLFDTRDGVVALNLSRPEDREMIPALFRDAGVDGGSDDAIAARFAVEDAATILSQGRALGLAIAGLHEGPAQPFPAVRARGPSKKAPARPLVIDLSALWAGPLAGRLLRLAGACIIKVESRSRPDAMRDGDSVFFERLNAGKANLALDLKDPSERDTLIELIRRADIVIEAARPRALLQLGIDADAIVEETPGLVWMTITGHGVDNGAQDWVGFGDDCGVAAGLSAVMEKVTGEVGLVGDAIADPLTGIRAAATAFARRKRGQAGRIVFSMSGVVAAAMAWEQAHDRAGFEASLWQWAEAEGQPFPSC